MKKLFLHITLLISCTSLANCVQQPDSTLANNVCMWLNIPSIKLEKINAGLTNISYIGLYNDKKCIVRLGRENPEELGINRLCEMHCQQASSEIGIAPKVLYADPDTGNMISEFIHGNKLILHENATLADVVQTFKKYHALPCHTSFVTTTIFEKLHAMLEKTADNQPDFMSDNALQLMNEYLQIAEDHVQQKTEYNGLCHCDLVAENFISDGQKLWIIDWEYACWDNILIDLASFATELQLTEPQINEMLQLYFGNSWQEVSPDFQMMYALYNLRNALWYTLRSRDFANNTETFHFMQQEAEKHIEIFFQQIF